MSDEFGRWLQMEFDRRQWKHNEASRAIGVSHGLLRHWIIGNRSPSARSLQKVAAALNLPPESVFEAAGLFQPGHAPDPESVYAHIRGLVDTIDWDDPILQPFVIVGALESIVNDQQRRTRERGEGK